jgi:hypothetical protein
MDVEKFLRQCERIMSLCEKSGFDEAQSAMCCATVIASLLSDRKDAHKLIDATYKMAEGEDD